MTDSKKTEAKIFAVVHGKNVTHGKDNGGTAVKFKQAAGEAGEEVRNFIFGCIAVNIQDMLKAIGEEEL